MFEQSTEQDYVPLSPPKSTFQITRMILVDASKTAVNTLRMIN